MSNRIYLILGLCFIFFTSLDAQVIRGIVLDSLSGEPMVGVTVLQLDTESEAVNGTVTGIDGKFEFTIEELEVYSIQFSYLGYYKKEIPNVELASIYYDELEVILQGDSKLLDCELIIKGYPYHFFSSNKIGEISIDGNHPGLAASFNDPSRSLIRYPGMSVTNDQANAITYRGLPSEFTSWRMDGAEIVNPNHLSNAGTLSDRASANAGGVMAIPFESLEHYRFHPNPYSKSYSNAISGISNLEPVRNVGLKPSFLKFGFLGAEGAFNKRFNKDSNVGLHSVSAQVRYSFTGLLSDLGVDLGDEEIKYQDANIRLKLYERDRAGLYLTGVYGKSTNDSPIANFKSDLYIGGLSYVHSHMDGNPKIDIALFYSSSNQERYASLKKDFIFETPIDVKHEETINEKSKLAFHFKHRVINRDSFHFTYGLNANLRDEQSYWSLVDNTSLIELTTVLANGESPSFNSNLFLQSEHKFGALNIKPEISLASTSDEQFIPEGSLSIGYRKAKHEIALVASKSHQLPSTILYSIAAITGTQSLESLKSIKSYDANLSYSFKPYNNQGGEKFNIGIFYQSLFDVPVSIPTISNPEIEFDPFTGIDLISPQAFTSRGKARTYGMTMMVHQELSDHFHLNVNGSLFDAKYSRIGSEIEFNSPYNFGYTFNSILTKRQFFGSKQLFLSLAYHMRGAGYSPQINVDKSLEEYRSIYTNNFVKQENIYYRLDLRMRYEFGQNQLILDIQNVTNRENDGFVYYNSSTEQIEEKKQLGMIPVLSYKRLF